MAAVEPLQVDDGILDTRTGPFDDGAVASAAVEALITAAPATADPDPPLPTVAA